jgi:uncharacterized protein YyaL (SSP411 family)
MVNHLKDEDSPYLQQHANNPVAWYPWGEEAFAKAKEQNKAIFVSIGYSACHWCHVMERESFENETTAKILNEHFIAIKVDREERPDIDKHFQEVYQLMNQRPGGWPTSIFLTQDQKPFYSATYIPPEPRYGMQSFPTLLEVIADKYQKEPLLLTEKAEEILQFLNKSEESIEATRLDTSIIGRMESQAKQLFDSTHGGFNKAPKFPQTSLLSTLMDIATLTKNHQTLDMALFSLRQMAKGGLRDLVDGGFCRYSTDDRWLVPHFEKMTYDNALLIDLYLKAYQQSSDAFYKEVAFETIEFMLSRMQCEGLFFSASDADSQGVEGEYFLYSYQEAMEAFKEAGIPTEGIDGVMHALGITQEGNFEGRNIITLDRPKEEVAHYEEAIEALRAIRQSRVYPFVDEKIILSWNAMMIKALFRAGRIEKRYETIAITSLDALLKRLYIHGELYHTALGTRPPKVKAFLEDYAYLGEALIEAYESTLDESYLISATKMVNHAIENYFDRGYWKFSRGEFETRADIYDNSYPSAVATMVSLLYSIASLVDGVYKKFVFKSLEIYSYDLMRQPISSPSMSRMVMRYLKDDIIIKASEAKLAPHIAKRDQLPHPFCLLRVDSNEGYMVCNSSSCFGHEGSFEAVEAMLKRR